MSRLVVGAAADPDSARRPGNDRIRRRTAQPRPAVRIRAEPLGRGGRTTRRCRLLARHGVGYRYLVGLRRLRSARPVARTDLPVGAGRGHTPTTGSGTSSSPGGWVMVQEPLGCEAANLLGDGEAACEDRARTLITVRREIHSCRYFPAVPPCRQAMCSRAHTPVQ